MRYFRLPFFPMAIPLFLFFRFRLNKYLVFAIVFAILFYAFEIYVFDSRILIFLFSMTAPMFVFSKKMKYRGLFYILVSSVLWSAISVAFGYFPYGEFPFEIFFASVFTSVSNNEWVAGYLSRVLLISINLPLFLLSLGINYK